METIKTKGTTKTMTTKKTLNSKPATGSLQQKKLKTKNT
jgi:hypothetical protein